MKTKSKNSLNAKSYTRFQLLSLYHGIRKLKREKNATTDVSLNVYTFFMHIILDLTNNMQNLLNANNSIYRSFEEILSRVMFKTDICIGDIW